MSRGYSHNLEKNFEENKAAKPFENSDGKRNCAGLIRMYYGKNAGNYSEIKAVESAVLKIESGSGGIKGEYDGIFAYYYENGRRNVNSVAIERWLSPSSVYRKLDIFCAAVKKELGEMKKYAAVTVLRY